MPVIFFKSINFNSTVNWIFDLCITLTEVLIDFILFLYNYYYHFLTS